MTLTRNIAGLVLFLAIGCSTAPRRSTPAFTEQPLVAVAVLRPIDLTKNAGASEALSSLWEAQLAQRGWELAPPNEACAILHSSLDRWQFRSGGRSARVSVHARLVRRSDGALLWEDDGVGSDDWEESLEEEEGRSLLDSATEWVAGSAVQAAGDVLGFTDRERKLREAARDAVADALYSLPPPSN